MNVADLATAKRTPACWDAPQVFANHALDYDARDDTFAHLDLLGHTMMAHLRKVAEVAAVDVCFGCPLMMACEKIDVENDAEATFIPGVVGGRTEGERRARKYGEAAEEDAVEPVKASDIPNPQIAPGDRGPRNQVDDELIASLTRAGKTSDQIAEALNCSSRTVSRSRKRNTNTANSTAPCSTPKNSSGTRRPNLSVVVTSGRKNVARRVAEAKPMTNPFMGGRAVSDFMEAIYTHLSATGGSADKETLIAVGMQHVGDDEALSFRPKRRKSDKDLTTADLIRAGARAKVYNAMDATARKGRYLLRDGDTFTFNPTALAAWNARLQAQIAC